MLFREIAVYSANYMEPIKAVCRKICSVFLMLKEAVHIFTIVLRTNAICNAAAAGCRCFLKISRMFIGNNLCSLRKQ
jgi:hypothetical protein